MFCKKSFIVGLTFLFMFLICCGAFTEDTFSDWPYPKKDLCNTSSVEYQFPSRLSVPHVKWALEVSSPNFFEGWWGSYICIADLDDNGQLEVLVAQGRGFSSPQRLVALSVSDGTEKWEFQLNSEERIQWASPVVVDIDEDGQLEVVFGSGSRVLILNGKTGTIESEFSFPGPMCLSVARLSSQEKPNIIVNSYQDPKRCCLLEGRSGSQLWEYTTDGSAYNVPAIADINNDGNKEILFHVHRYNPSRETEFCLTANGEELWRYDASPSSTQEEQAPPELGWVPDFGYISTVTGDFLGNGEQQVYFATRCHAYLLSTQGELIWRYPLVEGFGILLIKDEAGNIEPDTHGTGGSEDHAAVGDVTGDDTLDIVMGLDAEYRGTYDLATQEMTYERIDRNNRVIALDGATGELLWAFEGQYPSENGLERMRQPILVDLDDDGNLDVVVVSTDGSLYGLSGTNGETLWNYPLGVSNSQLMGACVVDGAVVLIVITIDYTTNKGELIALELPPLATPAVFRVTKQGNVQADGAYYGSSFESRSADVAEWVPVSEPVEPGDVLELDPENPGHYRKARGLCSNLVAGVVSTDPGFILGSSSATLDFGQWTDDSRPVTEGSALLALLGIVPVKVTDEGGPIKPGDLLVSSSTPGYAMRWDPDVGSPCALVGKALELLETECGVTLVLITVH